MILCLPSHCNPSNFTSLTPLIILRGKSRTTYIKVHFESLLRITGFQALTKTLVLKPEPFFHEPLKEGKRVEVKAQLSIHSVSLLETTTTLTEIIQTE